MTIDKFTMLNKEGCVLNTLNQLLSAELENIESLLGSELQEAVDRISVREKNARFLEIVLESPEMSPRELNKLLSSEFGPSSRVDVLQQFRDSKINTPQDRVRLVEKICATADSLLRLIEGRADDAAKDFDTVAKITLSRLFRERTIEGKLLLMAICRPQVIGKGDLSPETKSILSRLSKVAKQGSYKLCRETGRRLAYEVGQFYGLVRRQTHQEKVEAVLQDMVISRDVDDLLSSLFIVQKELSGLKDAFNVELEEAASNYVKNFFSGLNSPQNSHLLDTVAQTQQLIHERMAQGWDLPSELRVIPMVLELLLKALRHQGLEQIEQVGKIKLIPQDALSEYEFMGSQYPNTGKVQIVVRTPGWRMGSTIIAKPRVQEVSNECD